MRHLVTGEYLAQVRNPDPFAVPAWRSPVYRTPFAIVATVQAARLIGRLIRFLARHPIATTATGMMTVTWVYLGWPAVLALVTVPVVLLGLWRWRWPASFARHIAAPPRIQPIGLRLRRTEPKAHTRRRVSA
jgi:hypothetical protein